VQEQIETREWKEKDHEKIEIYFSLIRRMDSNTGGILGIFAVLTSAAGLFYTAINHKRIRCKCCGKNLDFSVDVDPTDKPKPKPSQTLPETASTIEILPRNVEKEDLPESDEEEEPPKVVLPPRRPNRLPKIAPY